jgi:hypothetical protein
LEFLGSEVESEDEADSDGEAHPVKEKDKWNSKIIAQVEKMSATKFLEFCEEQRCIIGNIWVSVDITIYVLIWQLICLRAVPPTCKEALNVLSTEESQKRLSQKVMTTSLLMLTPNNLQPLLRMIAHLVRTNFNMRLASLIQRLSNSSRGS